MHKLVFSGKILPGHDPAQVQAKLLAMLKLAPEQGARIFSGQPVGIKKGLSREEAERYVAHLKKQGIAVDVEPPLTRHAPFPTLLIEPEPEVVPVTPPAPKVPAKPAPAPVSTPELVAAPVDHMTCPKCGEYQPKRTLCRACSVDMPRYLEAQQAKQAPAAGLQLEAPASPLSTPRPNGVAPGPAVTVMATQGPKITPFWERLPQFFLFPLQGMNLVALVLLSLSILLAHVLPLPMPLDFLLVQGAIMLFGMRRGFVAMDAMSRGYITVEDQANMLPDPERNNLPWKLLGVMIVWGIIVNMAGRLGSTVGFLVWGFTVLTLPAATMALSVSNSFSAGLNPLLWIRIVRGVGKSYIVLFLFLTLLSGGTRAALPLLAPFLKGWLALPLINFTFLYFMLIMFALMGYVLYQFHWELGVPVDQRHLAAQMPTPADATGDEIARLVAAGELQGAVDLAHEQQRLSPEDLVVQERYHKLLMMAGKNDRALEHGRRYLSLLLQRGQGSQAVALFKRLSALDKAVQPATPQELIKLAQAAHAGREHELALTLAQDFEGRNPGRAGLPEAHFLLARIHSEAFRRDDTARQILRALCEKHPEHEVVKEAAPYLRALDAIHGAAVKPA